METRQHRRRFGAAVMALAAVLAFQSTPVIGGNGLDEVKPFPSEIVHMKETLERLYPSTRIDAVRATPVPGLYEVSLGRNLAYISSDGRYWLFGHLYDMQSQRDLTAERQEQYGRIDFSILPLSDAITIKRGNGSRVLAVFSDPDCPYCKRLEQELAKLDDVTVHVFLYPLESIHPQARAKSIAVWCARDRVEAWRNLMLSAKTPPKAKASCTHPVDRNIALATRLGINGTPALFNAAGMRLDGAAPVQRIEAFLTAPAKIAEAQK